MEILSQIERENEVGKEKNQKVISLKLEQVLALGRMESFWML